ncbi:MAG: U32 family peptidase [Coprobacter sp.]|nr:U32 family peptidase [Coprobacter sp.]
MTPARKIELLAPARTADIGRLAVEHGADAVYIGAPRFGARASAGNTVADIARLVEYAHLFGVRIYVTLNTLLLDEELDDARRLVGDLWQIGVDALIVQDMGLLQLDLPPIALHASTQTDNRTPEKVRFLSDVGFSQVVLARELSLRQIQTIHEAVDVPLEAFVHGALCVSYSGQCYISAASCGRSANRGECAQFCRLPYTLVDADGREWVRDRHLLSLKDFNLSDRLEALLDAGVTSLKIEGRLKDAAYVKNVTAFYRRRLDEIFARRSEYLPASCGTVRHTFTPDLAKSFNRGFTRYFFDGSRDEPLVSLHTPKSVGEPAGRVVQVAGRYMTVAGHPPLSNGDGMGFVDRKGRFEGFRINRVEGDRLYPARMPDIQPGTPLYRNYSHEFEKALERTTAERTLAVDMTLYDTPFGLALEVTDQTGMQVTVSLPAALETAHTPQDENRRRQLSRLGDTPFRARRIDIRFRHNWFVPASVLADLRRRAVDTLMRARKIAFRSDLRRPEQGTPVFPQSELTYLGNVSNRAAARFYARHGVQHAAPAFEVQPVEGVPLMFTRHCIKHLQGWCPRTRKQGAAPREPLFLVSKNARFRLEFDCRACEMKLVREP